MGTKPVMRDDGKTVTGHVWVKGETERATEDLASTAAINLAAAHLRMALRDKGIDMMNYKGESKWPATPTELEVFARMFFDRCLEVMRAKNARYAGEEDPFRNLRRGGVFGIAVRMDDKVSRMLTLSHPLNKLDGLDESIEDTAVDMANYAMLAIALYTHLMTPKINLGGK